MPPRSPAPPTRTIAIRLLGPVDIRVGGAPLAVDTRKAIALLAYLALTGRPASRESLGALLWPDSGDQEARGALRRTLSVLNSALDGTGLTIDRTSVALDPGSIELDVARFRDAVTQARGHGHEPDRACGDCQAALEAALALDRGGLMEGFSLRDSEAWDEWIEIEREAHQRELAGALERLVRERLAAGGWDGAIVAGRRWFGLDPLHEPAHRALMEAYARSGETAAAVRQYRDAAAILDRELGVGPLPETTELYEAILAGELATASPPGSAAGEAATSPSAPAAAAPGRPSIAPLIGRADELERVSAALALGEGSGRLAVIEGEAGIGKTRLADAVTERAATMDHPVVAARCYAGEAGIALAPIAGLLRSVLALADGPDALARLSERDRGFLATLVPELERTGPATGPGPASGPAARLRLLEAIAAGLGAIASPDGPDGPARPVLVRLDDLQWADDSTLEALAYLARRLETHPIALLLSWRREDLDERAQPLVATADAMPGAVVRLDRLAQAHVRELVDAIVTTGRPMPSPAILDALVDEAEGLPLYVVEALAVPDRPAGAMPAGIRALLQGRLAGVSDVATQVVAAAAVIGRSFGAEAARAVSGRSDDETVMAIEELLRRGIVNESTGSGGPVFDFVHARLRDVAYETTSVVRRRLLHRRAAEALRGPAGRDLDQLGRLARIATHEQAAGRGPEAAAAYREAGDLARAVFANREALAYLEAALALGDPDVLGLHLAIGEVAMRTGDYPKAISTLETAAASAPADRLATIEHRLGQVHLRRGDPGRAGRHLAAAVAALDEAGEGTGPRRSDLLADQAVAAARSGRPESAAALALEARALATGDIAAEAEADRILGLLARDRGDLEDARALLERSLAAAATLPDPVASIAAANALALVVADQGDIDLALTLAESASFSARRAGERHLEAAVENNLADMLRSAGRDDEALEHLREAVTAFADVGGMPGELEPGIWMLETW